MMEPFRSNIPGGKLSNLLRYKEFVRTLSNNNDDFFFDNSNIFHAQIVISELLSRSKEEVVILTDNFNQNFYENFLMDKLKEFLSLGKKLHICILNKGNNLLEELARVFPDSIKIYNCNSVNIPDDLLKDLADSFPFLRRFIGSKINFVLDDKKGARLEIKEDVEKGITKAVVNFNNEVFHNKLLNIFNWLISSGCRGRC